MSDTKKDTDTKDTNLHPDQFTVEVPEKRLEQLQGLLKSAYYNLEKISRVISRIEQEQKKELYKKMPGVEGVFDGTYLVAGDGSKHEVPPNYAAKSRLVFGDKLKIVEEDGKQVFKQIEKSERKEIKGVLSKKEGKWYLLSDLGTYKISDIAADFNKAQLKEEAIGLVPADNTNVPFAALDRIERPVDLTVKEEVKDDRPVIRAPVERPVIKPVEKSVDKPIIRPVLKPPVAKTVKEDTRPVIRTPQAKTGPATPESPVPAVSKDEEKPKRKLSIFGKANVVKEEKVDAKTDVKPVEPKKEFVANLMSDDDLR
jgi:hypothetical protein